MGESRTPTEMILTRRHFQSQVNAELIIPLEKFLITIGHFLFFFFLKVLLCFFGACKITEIEPKSSGTSLGILYYLYT